MRQVVVYRLAVKALQEVSSKSPDKGFTNKSGEKVTIGDIATELDKVAKWVYPDLQTEDISIVVRCKRCKYYKRYRKKGALKQVPFYACSKDMKRRDPMFFCKDGERA